MAGWEDVRRVARGLPGSEERSSRGMLQWRVGERLFVWERPLRRPDLEALGDTAPDGPILGVRVAHVGMKDALIEDLPDACFTIPHFEGYPAILVRLERITTAQLNDLVIDAWLARAPARLTKGYSGRAGGGRGSAR